MPAGACQMITMALEAMAVSCSGKVLEPGVCMTDHCDGERLGFMHTWPDAYHAQCWPHISRKMKAGTLGKTYFRRKKHEEDDEEDGEEDGEEGAADNPNQDKQKTVKDLCKDHPMFVDICMHLKCLHHCQSEEMRCLFKSYDDFRMFSARFGEFFTLFLSLFCDCFYNVFACFARFFMCSTCFLACVQHVFWLSASARVY